MITIDRKSKIAITQQIVQEFENRIRTGLLKPEAKLPSIRSLSKDLQVSAMTIVTAYENLELKGLINKIQGKGSFVTKEFENLQLSDGALQRNDAHWTHSIQDYVTRSGYARRVVMTGESDITNLAIAALHHRFLPTKQVLETFSSALEQDFISLSKFPPIKGDPLFIANTIDYLNDKDIKTNESEVMITSGSQAAIHLIAETFISHGDVVVVESPTYPGAIDVFKNRGALVLEVPMDENGIRIDKLLMLCEMYPVKLLYTMPIFHNPTGITANLETMTELLKLASDFNFIILEDDSWSDMYFGKMERPLKGLDLEHRVLYVGGMSKIFGPSYRLSALVCHPVFLEKLLSAKANIDSGTPLINQRMLVPYLNTLDHKQHLTWLRHELLSLKDRIFNYLLEHLPKSVALTNPKGGLVFWLTFPYKFDCNRLYYQLLHQDQTSFLSGSNCYSTLKGNNQMRICYSYLEEGQVLEGLEKLVKAINEIMN